MHAHPCVATSRCATAFSLCRPALAGEIGPGLRTDLGLIGGTLHFLGAQPFVLLYLALALGTVVGRSKLGFISRGIA